MTAYTLESMFPYGLLSPNTPVPIPAFHAHTQAKARCIDFVLITRACREACKSKSGLEGIAVPFVFATENKCLGTLPHPFSLGHISTRLPVNPLSTAFLDMACSPQSRLWPFIPC